MAKEEDFADRDLLYAILAHPRMLHMSVLALGGNISKTSASTSSKD